MIAPQGYVVHHGRRYRLCASFEDTEAGDHLANLLMLERSDLGVLCTRDGWTFVVRLDDTGEPVR